MGTSVGCIVEGHGEVEAVPVLIRRIAAAVDPTLVLRIPHPIRIPRSRLVKPGELERAVELAARQVGARGAVLVVLDADDDCPAQRAPELLGRAVQARPDLPIGPGTSQTRI